MKLISGEFYRVQFTNWLGGEDDCRHYAVHKEQLEKVLKKQTGKQKQYIIEQAGKECVR